MYVKDLLNRVFLFFTFFFFLNFCPDESTLHAGKSGGSGSSGIPTGPRSTCPPYAVWLQQAATGQIFSKSVRF